MKKFIVNSEVLLKALLTVAKVIEKRAVVPILENYLFTVSNGQLSISGNDLQNLFTLAVDQVYTKIDRALSFSFVVPQTIVKYLQKIDLQPLKFAYDDKTFSIEVLTEDNARAKYSGETVDGWPITKDCNVPLFDIDTTVFNDLKDLLNYVSENELRPAMTGIYFGSHMGKFQMCATDAHILKTVHLPALDESGDFEVMKKEVERLESIASKYRYGRAKHPAKIVRMLSGKVEQLNKIISKQAFLMPAKPAKILSGLTFGTKKTPVVNPVSVACYVNEAGDRERVAMSFDYEGFKAVLSFRNIDERFPQYWNVIPDQSQTKTTYTGEKAKFISVIDKAVLFAPPATKQIRLALNGVNKISAEDLDFSNEFCAEVKGSYVGEPMEIGFNADYLKQAINSFGDSFNLDLIAPNKAGVLRDDRNLVLVMPVMITNYEAPTSEQLAKDLHEAREQAAN